MPRDYTPVDPLYLLIRTRACQVRPDPPARRGLLLPVWSGRGSQLYHHPDRPILMMDGRPLLFEPDPAIPDAAQDAPIPGQVPILDTPPPVRPSPTPGNDRPNQGPMAPLRPRPGTIPPSDGAALPVPTRPQPVAVTRQKVDIAF